MGSSERSATDDIVSAIMGRWATAFSSLDAGALASLYSRNAFFFGSNPNLYRGNDGVAAYFDALPRWSSPSVQFTDVRTAHAAADLINVAGTATFVVEADAEPLRSRSPGSSFAKAANGRSSAITSRRRRR